jgi:glycosyltransferase involved in cell wall biosynthesis
MKIGLNLLSMIPGVVGGMETYTRGLLSGLRQRETDHEFVLFLNRESAEIARNDTPTCTSVICPVSASNRINRYYFEQVKLRQYLKEYRIDLLHSLGYVSPLFLPCRTVVSIPDLNFKAFGNLMPFSRRWMLRIFVKQAIVHSNKIITISEFSKQEILREYHIPSEKIVVTHLAAGNESSKKEIEDQKVDSLSLPGIKRPYIIAFSASYPNKNISRLVEAFSGLKKNNMLEQKLILVGHKFPEEKGRAGIESGHESKDIIWTGYLDRQQVVGILKQADFLVFPSFYEGFGLPILEAMTLGIPVVCSNAASLPEVANDAAVFFDPFSIEDMAKSIVSVANDPQLRTNLQQKGFNNVKRFSWEKTAEETMAVYDDLLRN